MYAALVVAIDHRISAIWWALEGAAASDPEAGRLYVAMVRQRRGSMQEAAQLFAEAGALRPDVDASTAADLMWLCNDPSLYDKLVRQRGWSVARFQAWLTRGSAGATAWEGSRCGVIDGRIDACWHSEPWGNGAYLSSVEL